MLVKEDVKGSPADEAGLKVGDVIATYEGNPIDNRKELQYYVTSSDAGKAYPLTYLRGGEKHEVKITPQASEKLASSLPTDEPTPRPRRTEKPLAKLNSFGLAVTSATPELLEKYHYPKTDLSGLVVTRVDENGAAAAAGLEEGDLIERIVKDKKIVAAPDVKAFDDLAANAEEIAVEVRDAKNPSEFRTLSRVKK